MCAKTQSPDVLDVCVDLHKLTDNALKMKRVVKGSEKGGKNFFFTKFFSLCTVGYELFHCDTFLRAQRDSCQCIENEL